MRWECVIEQRKRRSFALTAEREELAALRKQVKALEDGAGDPRKSNLIGKISRTGLESLTLQ